MTDVVIIAHNEGNYVQNMIDSIPSDWNIVYVADRCDDLTNGIIKILAANDSRITVLINERGVGRLTSQMRNLGFWHTRPESDVLFLDGDRVPLGSLAPLSKWDKDIALLMLEHDGRDAIDDYSKVYGTVHNAFYSCGVYFKASALRSILDFQEGKIFREDMQAMWGIEDTYLGDVCYHLNLTADLYRDCRLRGKFDKYALDSLDAIELRLKERNKLNVKWC